ncbi:MAG: serine--tRNA ligase, partial [Tepidisphaeraceae bacterium]
MIDLKDLREDPQKYRRGAELKGVQLDVAAILAADEMRVSAQQEFERLRAEQNQASQQIGKIKDPAEKKAAIARVQGELKQQVKDAEERWKAAEAAVLPLLLTIPQPPDEDVPVGRDVADNVVIRHWGEPRKFEFKPKSHIELGESLALLDFEAGVSLS